jgi:hypothetical protein
MFKNLSLSVASVLFSLVVIEIALRLMGWSFPVFMRPDRELGWSFRPGVSGWSSHENTAHMRINRFGFRGGDWPDEPAADSFRIAVIGDSFADSSNLPEDKSLPSTIGQTLSACPAFANRRVEVLNFGVSGYGTAQQYLLLQRRVARLHPQAVLLAFYAGNDVADNSRALSMVKTEPYFIEQPSGQLRLDMSFRDDEAFRRLLSRDWQRRLINRSYTLQLLKQLFLRTPMWPVSDGPQALDNASRASDFMSEPYPQLFSPPADDNWRVAWSTTERLLLAMHTWANDQKTDFSLAIIPAPIQALPSEELRRAAAQTFGFADIDYPVERVARAAAQDGIPFLSLLRPLRDYGDSARVFLYGFPPRPGQGHLNAIGSTVSGRTIGEWLCGRAQERRLGCATPQAGKSLQASGGAARCDGTLPTRHTRT